MIDSLDMRHFPQSDPPKRQTDSRAHDKIQAQIDQFIANGGQITKLTSMDYDKKPVIANRQQKAALKD